MNIHVPPLPHTVLVHLYHLQPAVMNLYLKCMV